MYVCVQFHGDRQAECGDKLIVFNDWSGIGLMLSMSKCEWGQMAKCIIFELGL